MVSKSNLSNMKNKIDISKEIKPYQEIKFLINTDFQFEIEEAFLEFGVNEDDAGIIRTDISDYELEDIMSRLDELQIEYYQFEYDDEDIIVVNLEDFE